MATPSYRSSSTANASTGSPTGTKPTGTADGDVLVASVSSTDAAPANPGGWTLLYGPTLVSARYLSVWSKVAASEGASWTWTTTTGGYLVNVMAIQNAPSANPVASGAQTNASSVNCVAPSVTPGTYNSLLVGAFMVESNSTFTPPSGMTEVQDGTRGVNYAVEMNWEVLASSGATGTLTAVATNAGVSTGWVGAFGGSAGAPPVVVGASSNNAASSTALGVAYPASIAKGDLLIAVICNASTSSAIVHPVGWTALSNPAGAIVSAARWADGTESGGAATWNWTGASASVGTIVRITGTNVNGIDAFSAQANASSANLTAPAITPKFNSCVLLNVYCDIGANTITVPTTQTAVGSSVGNSRSIVCGYEPMASNASTGTRVATATAAVNYGFSFALAAPPIAAAILPDSVIGSLNGVQAYRDSTIPVGPAPQAIGAGGQFFGRDPYTGFPSNSWQGWGGTASVSGTCKVGTSPLAGIWVYLSPMSSQGTVIGAVYTGDDGTFSFSGIAPGLYVVEGVDPTGTYNGEIYEEVTAY